jgi:putative ABC transport system ATP-binding protein
MTELVAPRPVLRASHLTKVYGRHGIEVEALRDIHCSVGSGELVAIMGPSGSGKSTLLYCLSGVDAPTSGKVWIDDEELTAMDDEARTILRRRKVGFVFQAFNLLPHLNVLDNVALPLVLDGMPSTAAAQRVRPWIELVHMTHRLQHRPAELSGGEQQRVAIARALATGPSILFADEPTGNLDSAHGEQVIGLIRSLVDEHQQTVMLVTHDTQIAQRADRVLVLLDGSLQFDGPAAEYDTWSGLLKRPRG